MDKPEYYDIHGDYFNSPESLNPPEYYDGSENGIEYIDYTDKWICFGILILFYVSVCYKRSGFIRNSDLNQIIIDNQNNINIQETIEKVKKNKVSLNDITPIDKICSICLEEFSDEKDILILDCNHIYHSDCIIEWIHKDTSCPLCRSSSLV